MDSEIRRSSSRNAPDVVRSSISITQGQHPLSTREQMVKAYPSKSANRMSLRIAPTPNAMGLPLWRIPRSAIPISGTR